MIISTKARVDGHIVRELTSAKVVGQRITVRQTVQRGKSRHEGVVQEAMG